MRVQLLRFAADGAPVAPFQNAESLIAYGHLATFNVRENRYEAELFALGDLYALAAGERCVVKLVPTDGGEEADLPIVHLIDAEEDPLERACAALETWRTDPAVRADPEGLIDLDAAINIVRSGQRFAP